MVENAAQLFCRLGRQRSLDGLDSKLFEGLPKPVQAQDVIELYGEEGSGKTQILTHLIANCILPKTWKGAALGGRGVCVILVDTDYHFSLVRLVEILEQRIMSRFLEQELPVISIADRQTFIKSCLSRLIITKCNSSQELLATVRSFDNILCSRNDICVMMIDSIGAFFWLDKSSGGDSSYEREKHQRKLVDVLKRYVDSYYLVVIATKPAIFSKDTRHEYMSRKWREFVKYRYVVSRAADESSAFRLKTITPPAENFVVEFAIDKGGLVFPDRSLK